MTINMWLELYYKHSNKNGFNPSEYDEQQERKMNDSKYGVYK